MPLNRRLRTGKEFVLYVWHRFFAGDCLRMAAGLSYSSLLAIVPLTAIAFAMLAAFPVFEGVRGKIQEAAFSNLLPETAATGREYFEGFVENAGRLTAVGIVGLGATSVLLLGTVESALNSIFRVTRPRPMGPRMLVFWALITLGPLLLGASLSLSTYLFAATEWVGIDVTAGVFGGLAKLLPTLMIVVALTVFYFIVPNRDVSFKGAVIGGAVAGILFSLLRTGFGIYVAKFPTYQAVYGAVSVVPIFLVWMYMSWAVVLLGAVLTDVIGEWAAAGGRPAEGEMAPLRLVELALAVLAVLMEGSRKGGASSRAGILGRTGGSGAVVERVMAALHRAGFIENTARDDWVLARDLTSATLYDLFRALGFSFEDEGLSARTDGWHQRFTTLLADIKASHQKGFDASLREILAGAERRS